MMRTAAILGVLVVAAATLVAQQPPASRQAPDSGRDSGRFRSGVDLINVAAAVSDASGRFVPGLTQDDFVVYEDDQPQEITYFSADRVPVSLGLVLDTSGSMAGEKFADAGAALDRFLYDLLDPRDEVFLYRFGDHPILVQGWTTDRSLVSRALSRITPNGGTSLYDAVIEALPLASRGMHQKKALVIISDGNDTSSIATLRDVRDRLQDSEVLVYAVGIDGESVEDRLRQRPTDPRTQPRAPGRFPPGGGIGRPGGRFPVLPQIFGPGGGGRTYGGRSGDDRVNAAALRELTDDSGGRTEIIRSSRDLNPATASIADELSKQYSLGYASSARKDGRWHSIRVEVRNRAYRVRARRGYVAS
jgi:Ca-activated chloride channel family protein